MQPRAVNAPLVGTNLLQQLRIPPQIAANPAEVDFMLHLKVQPRAVHAPLVFTNL